MRRRAFLRGATGVTVLVAGGTVWRAYDDGVFSAGRGPAYEPWKNWRSPDNGPPGFVSAAILAASTFNTQPWLFKVSASAIDVHVDASRNIGAFDPFRREQYISVGSALENLTLAAAAAGFRADTTIASGVLEAHPAGAGPRLVASVQLVPIAPQASALYDAIPHRHTNRAPFDPDRDLPPEFVEAARHVVETERDVRMFVFTSEADRTRVVQTIASSAQAMSSHPELFASTGRWFHADWRDVQKYRDGTTLGDGGETPREVAMHRLLPEWLLTALAPSSGLPSFTDLMSRARLFGAIVVRDRYERANSVRAGRAWQRAHLLATSHGVAARPANQAVQPTFMFYTGYPTRDAGPTPRRSAKEVTL